MASRTALLRCTQLCGDPAPRAEGSQVQVHVGSKDKPKVSFGGCREQHGAAESKEEGKTVISADMKTKVW